MHILELDAIPREKDKLVEVISVARKKQRRATAIRVVAGAIIVLATCMLLFTWVRLQPTKAHAQTTLHALYIPVITR